jgi:peptide/nickel transport system substrate-binding protein
MQKNVALQEKTASINNTKTGKTVSVQILYLYTIPINQIVRMKLTNSLFWCLPAILLFSCGGPEGKITDDSTHVLSADSSFKYVHMNAATKWDPSWSKENVVVYHWKGAPDGIHPTNNLNLSPTKVIMDYTQRFVEAIDLERLKIRPDLIKKLPDVSADGLTWTYELRDEPKWDDGAQLSVDDIIFTLMAWECPLVDNAYARSSVENLKEIKRDPSNPRKFIVVMKGPYIQNESFLVDIPIMERKFHDPQNVLSKYTLDQFYDPAFSKTAHPDLDAWAKEFNDPKYGRDLTKLNGLGPYQVTSWEDNSIVLSRKKNHWTSTLKNPTMYDRSYPDKIIFKVNVDDNSIALELLQQTIDASSWVTTHGLVELAKDSNFTKNYNYSFMNTFDYQFLGMNMKPEETNRTPFFTDPRVRRAIAYLTPVDEINQNYYYGKALRMASLVSPIKKEVYDNSLALIPYDVEKAKKLLDEAGWKDTDGDNIRDKMIDGKKVQFSCECIISNGPIYEKIANDLAKAMYPAGIKLNVRTMEFAPLTEMILTHKFDLYMGAWQSSYLAEDYKQIWGTSSHVNRGDNVVGFGNSASDALIDSIRVTLDPAIRTPMEKRLQKMVYDDQPYVFLFSSVRKLVVHKRFDNGDFYFERPGMFLSNLRLMAPGHMATMTTPN